MPCSLANWSHTYHCQPQALFRPRNAAECAHVITVALTRGKVLRAVGAGHSPSDLACTNAYILDMRDMQRILDVDHDSLSVHVEAGIILAKLHTELALRGLAMRNVGSISAQTLGGVISTATHGSGTHYPVMSADIISLSLLLANGSCVDCSRQENPELFFATLCGLGTTGIILSAYLRVERAFRLQETQSSIDFEFWLGNLATIIHSAEHVRFWWIGGTNVVRSSVASRTTKPQVNKSASWFWDYIVGFHVIQLLLFLARFISALHVIIRRLVVWLYRSPVTLVADSHEVFNVPCRKLSYLSHSLVPLFVGPAEWAIPIKHATPCLRDLRDWLSQQSRHPKGLRAHCLFEIRFSCADDIWLSPSYGRDTCWIGIMQLKPYGANVSYRETFSAFATIMHAHQGRPHWAKAHHLGPNDLRTLYPHFDDFLAVLQTADPTGLFQNEYIRRHLFGAPISNRVFKLRPY
ncbi:L-gulonolactone D-arabinono-1,4-lactone oxidase [Mycena filopes]|nr:L-gulonolactone D-arabinono-1,4-lactone oxidase [Mycena filopes]